MPFNKKEHSRAPLSFDDPEKRSVTPEKAVEILKKHGTEISVEEAKLVLDFMYKFSKSAMEIDSK